MDYKKEVPNLVKVIKSNKDFTFWDLVIKSPEKIKQHCNFDCRSKYASKSFKIITLDIKDISPHFYSHDEEKLYVDGYFKEEDYDIYHKIALKWSENILLTPPTLIFFEKEISHQKLPRIHIHDGKHRFTIYRQFKISTSQFVIPKNQISMFEKKFTIN